MLRGMSASEISLPGPDPQSVTRLLQACSAPDSKGTAALLALVYDQLRAIAAQRMAQERPGHTLQATALVHEAYLRLIGDTHLAWDSRGHFFAAAAEAMRRILIERARRRGRLRHGGGWGRVDLDAVEVAADPQSEHQAERLLLLDQALTRLAAEAPEKAQVVKLRYFTGLTHEEIASAIGISRATVERHWAFARAWLMHEVKSADNSAAG